MSTSKKNIKNAIWMTSLIATVIILIIFVQAKSVFPKPQSPDFMGHYIAAISDGDFLASTYADDKLPVLINPDRLSLINLPIKVRETEITRVDASNSVTGAPYAFDITANGRTAFIVETLAPAPPGATTREQLQPGQQLTTIDLSDPRRPRVIGQVAIAPKPETISVHPQGNLLAISTQTPDKEILLVPVQNRTPNQPIEFSLRQLGIVPDSTRFEDGMYSSYVQWHPSGRYLAVNLTYRDQVAFFELKRDYHTFHLVPWGTPVKVGKDPFTGRFTPDGRFYITSDWGRNFGEQIETLEARLPTTAGTVSVIQLAKLGTSATNAQHQVVSTATSDLSPESLAISPDGSMVVTVNMRGTAFPQSSPRFTPEASLSLLMLDRQSGKLTKVDDYPFTGILPESVAFEASGNYLAVAIYDFFTSKPEGGVELWQVILNPTPKLQQLERVIDVGRGTHQVLIAPP
jgi:DNA-binding beta-propeller fold protein YncE